MCRDQQRSSTVYLYDTRATAQIQGSAFVMPGQDGTRVAGRIDGQLRPPVSRWASPNG